MHISFKLRKKNAMNKLSMAKSEHLVDVAMYDILDALNAHPDLFTTSSCSGRIQLIAVPDVGRKDTIVMRHRWHHELNFEELEEIINTSEINEDAVVILQAQSPILHLGCRTMEMAMEIRNLAQGLGWKYCSLMGGNDDRWMVEILSSYRMDFALFRQGVSAIPDRDWLRFVTKEANKVFMKGQEKLSSLKQIPQLISST